MHCENEVVPGIDSAGGFAERLKTNARTVDDGVEGLEYLMQPGADGPVADDPKAGVSGRALDVLVPS